MNSTHARPRRPFLTASLASVLALAVLGGGVTAQSPAPSEAPASTAPASPAGSPAANPSTAPVDSSIAACDALLSSASITAVTGAEVVRADTGSVGNGNFPDSPSCTWTLSDGSSVRIDSQLELSSFGSGSIQKARAFGAKTVESLPQPAASIVWDGGQGQVMVGRVGPLLVETLLFSARSADGKTDDLLLLEQLAKASAAQPAVPLTVDPECASHLGVTVVGTQRYEAPSSDGDGTDLNCGYDLGDGTTANLALQWRVKNVLPDCCEKVKELGKGAFAQQNGTGKKAPWRLDWILAKGDPARVAELSNGAAGTRLLSKQELITLAKTVSLGTTVEASPSPTTAAVAIAPEAAGLVGSWAFQGIAGGLELPPGLTVTLTFAADGTVVTDFGCKPPKKKQPLSWPGTFTADATTLDVTWAKKFKGACTGNDAYNYSQPFSFVMQLVTTPGSWSVTGDTLTLAGTSGPGANAKLPFQRVTS